mmetsp:Transcript_17949/g.49741  ORF Transcript_17949/g.49741 Transcript_17949/m.49741 type:complete len:510 (+) Transcript_17949:487-2016(+)
MGLFNRKKKNPEQDGKQSQHPSQSQQQQQQRQHPLQKIPEKGRGPSGTRAASPSSMVAMEHADRTRFDRHALNTANRESKRSLVALAYETTTPQSFRDKGKSEGKGKNQSKNGTSTATVPPPPTTPRPNKVTAPPPKRVPPPPIQTTPAPSKSSSSSSNIERPPNWSYRGKRGTILSNVNGMLSEVPWAKHKPASYYRRHNGKRNNNNNNNTTIPTTPTVPQSSSVPQSSEPIVDHDSVLPVVLVRDPFYWMQSMCREGYGVRWDHDAKRHCPNLVPDASDRARAARKESRKQKQRQQQWQGEDDTLPLSTSTSSVPVWMGANPTEGQTWPSLIHYWNAWYESYYYNHDFDYYSGNDYYSSQAKDESVVGSEQRKPKRKPKLDRNRPGSNWPRLIVRFEDTLFYPSEVMAEVCHCGGGRLIGEPSSGNGNRNGGSYEQQIRHDYSLEDSKPHHRHEGKSNFVQAMVRYGTNATRLHNMTRDDIRFAVEHLNPELMKAFGYSYPSKEYYE